MSVDAEIAGFRKLYEAAIILGKLDDAEKHRQAIHNLTDILLDNQSAQYKLSAMMIDQFRT